MMKIQKNKSSVALFLILAFTLDIQRIEAILPLDGPGGCGDIPSQETPGTGAFHLRTSVVGTEIEVYPVAGGAVRGRVLEIGEDSLAIRVTGGSLMRTRRNSTGFSEGQTVSFANSSIQKIDISPPSVPGPVPAWQLQPG